MEEKLLTYFINETNKKIQYLTEAVTSNSKDIATLLADHHTKYERPRSYQLQKYGVPTGIASALLLLREIVVYLTN